MSATLSFTGRSSILTSYFHPELELDSTSSYSCALLEFTTYNSIPNVTTDNDKLYFLLDATKDKEIIDQLDAMIVKPDNFLNRYQFHGYPLSFDGETNKLVYSIAVPMDAYELKRIFSYLMDQAKEIGISLQLSFDESALTSKVKCSVKLLFNYSDSIHQILGFSNTEVNRNEEKTSDRVIAISRLNTITIECDIVDGSFTNGIRGHSLHEFAPAVPPGYKIIELPKHIIYLPINRRVISSIQIRIVDQDGRLVDFRGEKITCRIHIKKD